jgi:DegV family protein with EDD domain
MSVAIVTDTGCDLPPGVAQDLQVITVPLVFRFGLEEFADKSIPMPVFLERVKQTWPTTSAPSPGVFVAAFRESLQAHEQVLCIAITGKHSATYSSAVVASQQFSPDQVTVFDSASLSIGQGYLVRLAVELAQAGADVGEITAQLQALQRRSHLYIALDTVENLVRGGRASQTTGFLAQVLKIRPILTLVDGQLTLSERPRGRAASLQKMLELAAGFFPVEYAAVGHVDCEEEAHAFAAALAAQTGTDPGTIPVMETGMAIAVHGGPGTLGVVVFSRNAD